MKNKKEPLFSKYEVIAYIEELMKDQVATQEECVLYEDYLLHGKIKHINNTYKLVIRKMEREFNGE